MLVVDGEESNVDPVADRLAVQGPGGCRRGRCGGRAGESSARVAVLGRAGTAVPMAPSVVGTSGVSPASIPFCRRM